MFTSATGYWIHKTSTLPIGADLYLDIHKRIKYGPMTTMFDVGANTGQTWEWFRNNERGAKIYCFEPVMKTFGDLKIKTANDKNCIIENIAFGEVGGEKMIRLFDQHSALNSLKEELMNTDDNAREEMIKIDTIDNYCKKRKIIKIDLLKIDTEGYEFNVLEGANDMMSAGKISLIYCEIGILKKNLRNTNLGELTEWLAKKNYHFLGLYQMVTNGWKTGDYFGNALFVHKEIFIP